MKTSRLSLLALLAPLACGASFQSDGFAQKLRRGCADANACEALHLEGEERRRRCFEQEDDPLACEEVERQAKVARSFWLQKTVGTRHEAAEEKEAAFREGDRREAARQLEAGQRFETWRIERDIERRRAAEAASREAATAEASALEASERRKTAEASALEATEQRKAAEARALEATEQRKAAEAAEAEARNREAQERRKAAEVEAAKTEAPEKAPEDPLAEEAAPRGILCRDGTLSPSCVCGGPLRGCCSHHGGVASCE